MADGIIKLNVKTSEHDPASIIGRKAYFYDTYAHALAGLSAEDPGSITGVQIPKAVNVLTNAIGAVISGNGVEVGTDGNVICALNKDIENYMIIPKSSGYLIPTLVNTASGFDQPSADDTYYTADEVDALLGAISSGVIVKDEGSVVTGGPFTTLNIIGGSVEATDAGGGQANITVSGATNTVKLLNTPADIDGKTVATTNLGTVPVGKKWLITDIHVECTVATAITADSIAGVGTAAGEDDIAASEELTQIRTAGDIWKFPLIGKIRRAAAGEIVKLGIDTGAVGTTLTLRAYVYGLEIDA